MLCVVRGFIVGRTSNSHREFSTFMIEEIYNGCTFEFMISTWRGQGTLCETVQDGASISLEPGGQFELSGAPFANVHETCDEVKRHLNEVRYLQHTQGCHSLSN